MNEDHLIRAILDRISNPATHTDYSDRRHRDVGPPATSAVIEASQRAIGCALCRFRSKPGAVRELVGNESGVVSGVINLESPGVGAPGRRPRHDEPYHEAC
jgi:hypothetical protein